MITRFLAADLVVKDIDEAAKRYSKILGVKPNWKSYPDAPDLRECAFYPGNSKFVLLSSSGADPYGQFLREKGEGVIAIYFEVDDIEKDVQRLKELGVEFETEEPTTFAEGKVIHARASSMYGITTGFTEARSDLPWGKKIIPDENFPNKR
jgi:methylmalonyl-CoA/ethylmalonyl-CoA epimerase